MIKLNWYQEQLDKFYGDNNNGYVYGIDTEEERDKEYRKEE